MTFTGKLCCKIFLLGVIMSPLAALSQLKWVNVDTAFAPLPASVHVYKTTDSLDGKPFIAYYAEALLKDKQLDFTVDTGHDRRLTPIKFFERDEHPLLVVNCTFFSCTTSRSASIARRSRFELSSQMMAISPATATIVRKSPRRCAASVRCRTRSG